VVTCHGTDANLLSRPLVPWIARRVLSRGRVVTAVSRDVGARIARATGVSVDETHIQPMPAAVAGFRWSAGGAGVVVLGRLTAQKRVGLAIRALGELVRAGRPLALTIVGDGPERIRLEALVVTLGLHRSVRFTGEVPPQEVPEALGNTDVLIFPAEGEGFGLAAVEALLAGIPVVACRDGGGVVDVMETPGAGLVVHPDPAAIAAAVVRLLDDPGTRARAREAGRCWRDLLEPARVAEVCERWYREARGA
jgi:glycosyltransferase involved in cell wall biosynthesis